MGFSPFYIEKLDRSKPPFHLRHLTFRSALIQHHNLSLHGVIRLPIPNELHALAITMFKEVVVSLGAQQVPYSQKGLMLAILYGLAVT